MKLNCTDLFLKRKLEKHDIPVDIEFSSRRDGQNSLLKKSGKMVSNEFVFSCVLYTPKEF